MQTRSRLGYLDGLRALAALWVVCNHVWLTIFPTVGAPGNPRGVVAATTTWMVYGHFAVVAFIVLSGYSLAISTAGNGHRLRGGMRTFLRRRFVGIVVPYWGALLVSAVLATTVLSRTTGTHWDTAIPVTARGLLLHLTLLQDVATTAQINHALWSIAIEWHIYFLFPVILFLRRRIGLLPATTAVIGTGVAISWPFHGGLTAWAEANLLSCFAMGVAAREIVPGREIVAAGVVPRSRSGSGRAPWPAVTLVLVVGIVALSGHLGTLRAAQQSNRLLEPLVGLATALLLISLAAGENSRPAAALAWRPLAFVGRISFSIYLIHAVVLQLIWQYVMTPVDLPVHDDAALLILLVLGVPASVAAGWGYFHLVEQRCLPGADAPARS